MVQLVWHRDEFPFDKLGPGGNCELLMTHNLCAINYDS